jgi:hypothetical protein
MRITVCRNTGRVQTIVMRALDDNERRLVVSVPWDQHPAVTLATIRDQLTEQEEVELRAALGLDQPPDTA